MFTPNKKTHQSLFYLYEFSFLLTFVICMTWVSLLTYVYVDTGLSIGVLFPHHSILPCFIMYFHTISCFLGISKFGQLISNYIHSFSLLLLSRYFLPFYTLFTFLHILASVSLLSVYPFPFLVLHYHYC